METRNFLLEIGTEELPASYIEPAREQLKEAGKKWAAARQITVWATPRRLVLSIANLPLSKNVTIWGPPLNRARDEDGGWNKNAIGFARSQGKSVRHLRSGRKNGKEYLKLKVRRDQGRQLLESIPAILNALSFPKSMRWLPGSKFRFARPIRWLVCLWGTRVLPVNVAGVKAGRRTRGHRFFGRDRIILPRADSRKYERLLKENYVLVSPRNRRRKLVKEILEKAKKYWPDIRESDLDGTLLEEVNNLVEYPRVIIGKFDERFLTLPPRVLITVLKSQQRYFPVFDRNGRLLPLFIVVANGPYRDIKVIRENNERVLRARFADAEFFWVEDQIRPLEERSPDLREVIFHEKAGNYLDKIKRLEKLAPFIARKLGFSDHKLQKVKRAAILCKSDLTTLMVTEFTELQGAMGREYALREGEEKEVASAIYEHYLPRTVGDELPVTGTGQVLALADKLDTIVAFLSVGIKPSGSQDPYGLRRQALGVIRLLAEKRLSLSFGLLAEKAIKITAPGSNQREVLALLVSFFRARLKAYLEGEGFPSDLIQAVLAAGWHNFPDVKNRIIMLQRFSGSKALLAATTIVERTYNIFRKENLSGREKVKEKLLVEPAERKLFKVYRSKFADIEELINQKKYRPATELYARVFSQPLHDFFDDVLVNVTDQALKKNRLLLLYRINRLFTEKVADLALLQFERGEYII